MVNIKTNVVRTTICVCALITLEACGNVEQINRYSNQPQPQEVNPMWLASLDILDFLPIETKNAENGLIVTGHGKPPGGDTEYRATILIVDAAIDASALKLSLFTKNGPAAPNIRQGIEQAIISRAREIYSARNNSARSAR